MRNLEPDILSGGIQTTSTIVANNIPEFLTDKINSICFHLNCLSDIALLHNINGKILAINPIAQIYFPDISTAEATIGKTFKSFYSNEPSFIEEIFDKGQWFKATELNIEGKGFDRAHIYSIPYDKKHEFIISVIKPNSKTKKETERQLREQISLLEESNRLKSEFLANMSHEIRTPINGILGFSKLLSSLSVQEKSKVKEYTNIISQSGEALLNLVNDIIDISRIEAGKLDISKTYFDLNAVIKRLEALFKELLAKKEKQKVELIIDIPEEYKHKPCMMFSDVRRLRQIITNLFSNASKFTTSGHIKIGYFLNEEGVLLYVKDTGIGIRNDCDIDLFERYKQIAHDKINNKEGSGLGLSISKGIINLMGGKIWYTSKWKKGSTFFIQLPRFEKKKPALNDKPFKEKEVLLLISKLSSKDYPPLFCSTKRDIIKRPNILQSLRLKINDIYFDAVIIDFNVLENESLSDFQKLKEKFIDIPFIIFNAPPQIAAQLSEQYKISGQNIIFSPLNSSETECILENLVSRYDTV